MGGETVTLGKPEKLYVMGNEAMALAALESGVKVVAGYPGTPASEVVEAVARYPGVHAEWSANEKVAFEVVTGASLCGMRGMAVMKHNGTNFAADFLMHVNFTGVRGGLVLLSADDPGANSSQNEEDTRILTHIYGHLPVFDPCSVVEAAEMVKEAFLLSEETELCWVVRPVMRVCHARAVVEFGGQGQPPREPQYTDDRSRFVMSAVVEPKHGGKLRPVVRHEWLNGKQAGLAELAEGSRFNAVEDGEGEVGFVGCGIGYTYVKEAEEVLGRKFPVLKLGTLPLPRGKVADFLRRVKTAVVFEETEPVVERLLGELCYQEGLSTRVLGRSSFLKAEGELSTATVLDAIARLGVAAVPGESWTSPIPVPLRTRTQCVGCSYRGLLHALKVVARRHKAVVAGDIGCYDAGSFPPLELQSTIFCMGSSVPIACGMQASGLGRPVMAIIGDSTFFHNGILGLINAIHNRYRVTVVVADNRTTAMTGFQPHPGSESTALGEQGVAIDVAELARALGAKVWTVNPYSIPETKAALEEAVKVEGVSVVVSQAPCYLLAQRDGELPFERREVSIDEERCNGCMLCVTDFGCPAIRIERRGPGEKDKKARIDQATCVGCGLCLEVCARGAIK